MNEKKVVTVIVEGPSDENAIGGILKEFFSWEEVQFAVVHGDITSNYSTTKENVFYYNNYNYGGRHHGKHQKIPSSKRRTVETYQ